MCRCPPCSLDGTHGSQQVFSNVALSIYKYGPGNETPNNPVHSAEDALQQVWLGDSRHRRCDDA